MSVCPIINVSGHLNSYHTQLIWKGNTINSKRPWFATTHSFVLASMCHGPWACVLLEVFHRQTSFFVWTHDFSHSLHFHGFYLWALYSWVNWVRPSMTRHESQHLVAWHGLLTMLIGPAQPDTVNIWAVARHDTTRPKVLAGPCWATMHGPHHDPTRPGPTFI